MRQKPADPKIPVTVNIPGTLIDKLDAEVRTMRQIHSGVEYTRSDIIRHGISEWLTGKEDDELDS